VQHIFHCKAQEPRSHLLEFLRRIGGEELQLGNASGLELQFALQLTRHLLRRGLGRVHDRNVLRRHSPQQRLDQRIVSAAEQQHVGIASVIGECFRQINLRHLLGDRMVYPAFFDQRNEQRASLLAHRDVASLEGAPVGMAADGGIGADDDHVPLPAGRRRRVGARFNHADHFYSRRRFDLRERQRGGCVAGDHQQLRSLILQIAHRPDRIMRYGGRRLRSVGKAGGITEVEVVGVPDAVDECAQHGKATYTGIEYTNGWLAR